MGFATSGAVRLRRASVLYFWFGLVSPRLHLPHRFIGHLGLVAVFVHGSGGAFVVWLRLPANGLQRNIFVDRTQDRRRSLSTHALGRCRFFTREIGEEVVQAPDLDLLLHLDGLHICGLLHADS